MRTEDDLRAALASLECHAPDTEPVLAAVRIRTTARRLVMRRRLHRSLAAGGSLAAAAAAAAVVMVMSTAAGPGKGPPGSHGPATAAAVLRQLANEAAEQPTPVLGPVLYVKTELWGPGIGPKHYGLNYRSHRIGFSQSWYGPGHKYELTTDFHGKIHFRNEKISKDIYQEWWLNPAKLPVGQAALRRYLLGYDAGGRHVVKYPGPPGPTILNNAFQLMHTGPMRPAVYASLLRVIADLAQNPPNKILFFVLGNVTDRAGHRGIAIAEQTPSDRSNSPAILIFDSATGAAIAGEYVSCYGAPVRDLSAANQRCTVRGYGQLLALKGMSSFPRRWPKGAR